MAKTYDYADGYRSAGLLQAAADHLSAAQTLFKDENVEHLDSAGYLAHLGVELMLKAMLLHTVREFPETHSLEGLYGDVVPHYPKAKLRGCESPYRGILIALDKFYALRYPSLPESPGVSRGDWSAIKLFVDRLREAMPTELRKEFDARGQAEKSGRIVLDRDHR